jgi:hypothetical protein
VKTRIAIFSIFVVVLGGCGTRIDPLDRISEDLSASHGTWSQGVFPKLQLAETATADEVISGVLQRTSFDYGRITEHKILEVRRLRGPAGRADKYIAALVDTDFGVKIVLIKYAGPRVGWWSHVYDA